MPTDDERREVARRLRHAWVNVPDTNRVRHHLRVLCEIYEAIGVSGDRRDAIDLFDRLADLIEPNYRRDDEWEDWYGGLYHYSNAKTELTTIREFIEDVLWTAYTVDLGPNGNIDPLTGTDEGCVYTDKLFSEWERDVLRLTGGCDRDALLALADDIDKQTDGSMFDIWLEDGHYIARRIREALGVVE